MFSYYLKVNFVVYVEFYGVHHPLEHLLVFD